MLYRITGESQVILVVVVVFLFVVCYESGCGFLWCYLKSLCSLLMLGICGSCVVFSMGGSDSDVCIGEQCWG